MQAHVHLRNLKDQKASSGWYPLMGKLGQSESGKDPLDRICGSIRLRVQWVYDYSGLTEYYLICSDCRLETLGRSKEGMKRQLKSLQDAAKQKKEQGESFSIGRVPALAAMYKRKKGSLETDRDNRTTTTNEEKASRGIKGVLATEGKLKSAINAARFMVASRPSKLGLEKRKAFSSLVDSQRSLDIFADDGSYSDEVFDSSGSVDLLVDESSSRSRTFSIGDNSNDEAVPTQGIMFSSHNSVPTPKSPYSLSHAANARFSCLRWQSWEHHTNANLALHIPLFYPSWHISRAFINRNAMKPQLSKVNSPTAHKGEGDQSGMSLMAEFLKLPPVAPQLIAERENNYVCELMCSRASFSKAARRSLGSVLNLGGGEFCIEHWSLHAVSCRVVFSSCWVVEIIFISPPPFSFLPPLNMM